MVHTTRTCPGLKVNAENTSFIIGGPASPQLKSDQNKPKIDYTDIRPAPISTFQLKHVKEDHPNTLLSVWLPQTAPREHHRLSSGYMVSCSRFTFLHQHLT